MKEQIYVKRFIHSADDLPKVNSRYSVHSRNAGENDLHDSTWMTIYSDAWIRDYDYYLQPTTLAELISEKQPSKITLNLRK